MCGAAGVGRTAVVGCVCEQAGKQTGRQAGEGRASG